MITLLFSLMIFSGSADTGFSLLKDCQPYQSPNDPSLRGFRCARIPKDSVYEKLGLTPQDLVTEINHKNLANPNHLMELLSSKDHSPLTSLTVFREGKLIILKSGS